MSDQFVKFICEKCIYLNNNPAKEKTSNVCKLCGKEHDQESIESQRELHTSGN